MMISVATKAQVFSEIIGRRKRRNMVIISCLKDVKDMGNDDWTAGTYEEILKKYNAETVEEFPPVHPVDMLSIATKSNPIPMKEVPEDLFDNYGGVYLGEAPFVKTLQDDKFVFNIGGEKEIKASRWMMLHADQKLRTTHNDKLSQFYEKHGHAIASPAEQELHPVDSL